MSIRKFFILFPHILIVKGHCYTIFLDSQRGEYYRIENNKYNSISDNRIILITKDNKLKIDLLVNLDIGFIGDKFDRKRFLNTEYTYLIKRPLGPNKISNCIIDLKQINKHLYAIPEQLSNLLVSSCEIRVFDIIDIKALKDFLNLFKFSTVRSIFLYLKFIEQYTYDFLINSFGDCERIKNIIIYNSTEEKFFDYSNNHFIRVLFTKKILTDSKVCGKITNDYFSINQESITEAHHHNTCLNRKISIDAEGNIRNCPSMPESFGNIKDTTLQEALNHPDFKKYWNHKKDDIEVCKDCEFRYICTDCRAYLEDPLNEYSKPLKCGYDPYTGEWSDPIAIGWSTNPLKQATIKYYGMEEILKG